MFNSDIHSAAGLDTFTNSTSSSLDTTQTAYGLDTAASQHEAVGHSNLMGKSVTDGDGKLLIQNDDTTVAEINEVDSILGQSRYNRSYLTSNHTYTNYRYAIGDSRSLLSANETVGMDKGDSLTNPAHVGTVVYRSSATVKGDIGYTSSGVRDYNDYFSFNVGKSGDFKISLEGLARDAGLALYDSNNKLVGMSDKDGTSSELITKNLGTGSYNARVYSYDQNPWNHGATSYNLKIERQADGLESYWQNLLVDSSVENAALNAIKYDNSLSRDDVIGVIKSAGDYGSVTDTELTDLRNFYNKAINTTNVAPYLKVLSKKVLFSETSNQWYTGSDSIRDSLGNLDGGSSTNHLNLLIGKHFLGTDRPAIHRDGSNNLVGSYTHANGSLFIGGVSAEDLNQGATGDCYFLAGLGGVANDKGSAISDMFTDNGDGTWTVRFFTKGKVDYVTVDPMMATNSFGNYIYANRGQSVAGNNELWVALAEKAYAQVNESGRIGQDGRNFYGNGDNNGIGWGFSSDAIKHIANLDTKTDGLTNNRFMAALTSRFGRSELIDLVNSDRVVSVSGFNNNATNSNSGSTNISTGIQRHEYVVTDYNASTGRFTLENPWGTRDLSLTFDQLRQLDANFTYSKH